MCRRCIITGRNDFIPKKFCLSRQNFFGSADHGDYLVSWLRFAITPEPKSVVSVVRPADS